MNFFHFVVHRPILFSMIFLAALMGGIFAFTQLQVDLLPTVNLPNVSVAVVNPGMGAEDVEELITKKLERVFSDLGGLDHIKSISREGVSEILVEFEYGQRDIDEAAIEVQRRINEVRNELPATIEEPIVRKLDPAARPIMTLTFSAPGLGERELRDYVENRLKRRFELVRNVAKVGVNGGLIRQINILVDRQKAESYGISLFQIFQTLKTHNANIPAGALKQDESRQEIVARTIGQFDSVEEIRDIALWRIGGRTIYVRDVAAVVDSYKEAKGYAALNGKPAISLEIKKQTGSNTVEIAKEIHALLEELRAELPRGGELVVARDDSEFIHQAIGGIRDAAWQGFLLAFLAVFLMLGRGRPALVIFISVPISIISTFLVMRFANLNINMVTLYALTLSIGVNFDASVVILESVFRHMQEGKNRLDAAANTIQELAAPLLASTLTNVIVFLPLTQLIGYIGELMRAMALTAITAQVMALPVAILFTSNITPRIVTEAPKGVSQVRFLTPILRLTTGLVDWLGNRYEAFMPFLLRRKKAVLGVTVGVLLASFALVPWIGIEFMPRADQNQFFIDLETPVGSTLYETGQVVAQVEKILLEQPELKYEVVNIGGDEPTSPDTNKAVFSVKLISLTERGRSAVDSGDTGRDVISSLRKRITEEVPGIAFIQFVQPAPWWGSAGAPIEINLKGADWELLNETADRFVNVLQGLPGIFDVQKNTRPGKQEVLIHVDEAKLSGLGLQLGDLAGFLRTGIHGGDVASVRTELRTHSLFRDKDIYIVTRFKEGARRSPEDLLDVKIPTPSGKVVSLSTLASLERVEGVNFVSKEDKERRVLVSVQTSNEPLNELVFKRVLPSIRSVELPPGVQMTMSGEVTRMNDQFTGMAIGFGIAFLFVFMVLAGQFESIVQPVVMLAAIPVMMIGVLLALFLTGQTLNTTSGNGIFALMGVVVNTSVILIDYTNLLRKRGLPLNEAIIQAGKVRLRPILMTVSTTFFAMIPMAISTAEGSTIYKPLAIAFLGGILSSTVLTLVIIPVLYALADEWTSRFRKKKA